jgi:hypothetical protein
MDWKTFAAHFIPIQSKGTVDNSFSTNPLSKLYIKSTLTPPPSRSFSSKALRRPFRRLLLVPPSRLRLARLATAGRERGPAPSSLDLSRSSKARCCIGRMASSPRLVVAFIVIDSFEVRLNNTAPLADLVPASTSPPPRLPPRLRDLSVIDSPSPPPLVTTPSKHPLLQQIHGRLSPFPSTVGQKNPPPPGIRLRAPFTAGDKKLSDLSVIRCGPPRLSRPLINRRMARSLHPAVLASGDTTAHRWCALPRLRFVVLDVALVQRPFLIRPSLKVRFVIWLLNIYKVLFVKKNLLSKL